VLSHDQPKIEIGNRAGGNQVIGANTYVRRGHAVDIEAGKIQQFEELPAATVDVAEAKLLAKCIIVNRCSSDRLFL
jgi:hypothetical protein